MPQPVIQSTVKTVMEPFDYPDVRLKPGLFEARFRRNREYLASLPDDSLLYPFRFEALLPYPGQPFGGWEAPTSRVRSHFFGHYLSACARTYASSGDEEIRAKADHLIAELGKCQAINGDGYAGGIPERYLARVEAYGPNAYVWCPYYMIHKTLMGCFEMYKFAGNRQALDILIGMASYIKRRIDRLSDAQMAHMLTEEHGGMSHVLYQLYRETGDSDHLALARRWDHRAFLDPLAQNDDRLSFVHANTNLPKVYGAAEAYEVTGEAWYRDAVTNFWQMVYPGRTYATGGSSSQELWPEPRLLRKTLIVHNVEASMALALAGSTPGSMLQPANHNQETCTTFNWLWVTRYLLRWTGEPRYADQFERNLYNGILAAQNPNDGMFTYFMPMAPGTRKVFGTPAETFWCCYGTGVQAFSDLASSIYFRSAEDETLYVLLFTPSEVCWRREEGTVRLEQATHYPLTPETTLTMRLASPQTFELALRIPWWVGDDVEVLVNGQPQAGPFPASSFYRISREWHDGDTVRLVMPMHWYTQPLPDAQHMAALMVGPLTMVALADGEVVMPADMAHPEAWIQPSRYHAGRQMRFVALTDERDWQLLPLYQVKEEPYTMYARFK